MEKKGKKENEIKQTHQEKRYDLISYRLKCAKTANGLSHYMIYGDTPEESTLL